MKLPTRTSHPLWLLAVLCGSLLPAFTLDREAFSITHYDLSVRIEPEQHRLGARGKITLRNDSEVPQKIAVLQISSSLDWRSIRAILDGESKPVQFVTQPYTSDIDHTGALSEAIVTLPQEVSPHSSMELEIAYEGVILLDATRLTRIGTPEDAAKSSDWDQISTDFTGVRGAGYVAWYPISAEAANLSEGGNLFAVLARWKAREAGSELRLTLNLSRDNGEKLPDLIVNQPACAVRSEAIPNTQQLTANCEYQPLGSVVPAFLIANYGVVDRQSIAVYSLPTHAAAAESYADAAEKALPLSADWFGVPREKARTVDLPDPFAAPFESGALLLTPLANADPKLDGLAATHQLTHAAYFSSRPWIEEGLAHFAQALYLEEQKGRRAAIDYMTLHRSALSAAENRATVPHSEEEVNHSLVNTTSEEVYRSKAMCVWWMLRDMIGDTALKKALAAYRPERDKEPSYMPRLIGAQTERDLEWFFDDWVYRDRGLPDFKVESAFSRKTMNNAFMLTITVDNLGMAGAEVPVIVKFAGGEISKRLEVHAKQKAVTRVEVPSAPQEIVVNDGSVPESDITNNTYKIETRQD